MTTIEQPNEETWKLLVLLLKRISEEKKISQIQIAELTGLKQSNVSRMFAIKFPPSMKVFLKVAKAVGVNFYVVDQEDKIDFNMLFEQAMTELGRRPENLIKTNTNESTINKFIQRGCKWINNA